MSKVANNIDKSERATEPQPTTSGIAMPVDAQPVKENSHNDETPSAAKKRPRINLAALVNAVQQEVFVKDVTVAISDRKPPSQSFIRVHPLPAYQPTIYLLTLKEKRAERYVIDVPLIDSLMDEITVHTLYLGVTTDEVPFLWPVRRSNGEKDMWANSEHGAVEEAKKGWVRIRSNMNAGQYTCTRAPDLELEPAWPNEDMETLIDLAFGDRFITEKDHPVLLKLRGKVG